MEVFKALSPALLQQAEADMVEWLEVIGTALGHERLPDVETIAADFSNGQKATKSATTDPFAS